MEAGQQAAILSVAHELCPEAHAQLVVFSGNGRAMLWTWLIQIDASLLLDLSASILRFNGSVGAEQQVAILSGLYELSPRRARVLSYLWAVAGQVGGLG